ncbi:diguanylate phosphodiesterase [Stutzerimonas kirkiae]|uniref:Diguanylate phosphodiesterase n=1 Tax=Stutzerimonas kirkiae TaxID=2211392 RepID=A0A4Q9R490_9GAMM|nr:EAL domain-containing protein [Stutzerimonas kirkiae]TBU94804.1 diguanylate phosphodiesterase [Stutzerimonas kirkiae]TBV01868.1 diguanylate phosphodiesterase [Stutzerimonas kirkiae]
MEQLGIRFLGQKPEAGWQILDHGRHDPWLLVLACLIAIAGSLGTLVIVEHFRYLERPGLRRAWWIVGSLCLAGGVWSMHFISMLAMQAPVAISYDLPTTLLSLLVAFAAALLALHCMGRNGNSPLHRLSAALLIGLGIAAMHYSGMAAMRSEAVVYYSVDLFILSILVAVAASLAALLLAEFISHGDMPQRKSFIAIAALLMGAAVTSMHFTGMAALHLVAPEGTETFLHDVTNSQTLGLIIGGVTFVIIVFSLVAAWANRKLDEKDRDLQHVNSLLEQLDSTQSSLEKAAYFDPLTNLLNRRGFNRAFSAHLNEHADSGTLAVMFLDVDNFKRINDSLGHDAGDRMLRIVASRLQAILRENDLIARLGGDEFCVVAQVEQEDTAKSLACRLLQHMQEPIALADRHLVVTTSVGISLYPQDGTSPKELLKHADLALYQSKANGRNTVHFFNQQLKQKASLELQLEEDLRTALQQNDGLELFYQPIIELKSGKPSKLEALIRWNHPQHGLLTPERFIPVAEANGLIDMLDDWVLRQAHADLRQLDQAGYQGLPLAVNCSALNLCGNGLPQRIARIFGSDQRIRQRIELEVTESALLGDIEHAIEQLERIRATGVRVAIDDFGTGYSSLAYLKRLPLDTLKIDRCFIQDLAFCPQGREIVRAIIAMAHALQMDVVAEGVEDAEQLRILRADGCDQVQGFFFGTPMPLQRLLAQCPHHDRAMEAWRWPTAAPSDMLGSHS